MLDYTEYSAVTLALVELRAQVADDITRTHLSAALKRLQSLRDDALLRAAALPVGLKRCDGEPSLRQYRTRPGPGRRAIGASQGAIALVKAGEAAESTRKRRTARR